MCQFDRGARVTYTAAPDSAVKVHTISPVAPCGNELSAVTLKHTNFGVSGAASVKLVTFASVPAVNALAEHVAEVVYSIKSRWT